MCKKILIIDDETDLVELLQARLEISGYESLIAYDVVEGLKMAREKKPDLILLDVLMPSIKGYQVCRELKNDAATKGIPVIMLTAKAQEADKFWGQECGCDDYCTKPFETAELMTKITDL